MEQDDRWEFVIGLDEELLKGGVVLSEWCSVIVRETDIAFTAGAHLATIVTGMAGIETYLRSEYGTDKKETLYQLIEASPLLDELKVVIHELRKYRNKWVHVSDPWDDEGLLNNLEKYDCELEAMAKVAVRALRQVMYENQWI